MSAAPDEAAAFLAALGHDRLTFQVFPEREDGPSPRILHGPYPAHARRFDALNRGGAGIYFMVNRGDLRGRRAANVTEIVAYFADLDGAPPPPTWPVPPTALVESSPGRLHWYARVTDAPLEDFERVQKHIALLLDSDPKVCDLPRVMRLPGYLHQKREPFRSRVLELNPDAVYTHEELLDIFAVPAPEPRPPRRPSPVTTLMADGYARAALERETDAVATAPEGTRNDTLNRAAFNLGTLVAAGALEPSAAADALAQAAEAAGLPTEEAERTIANGLRAGEQHPREFVESTSQSRPVTRTYGERLRQRLEGWRS